MSRSYHTIPGRGKQNARKLGGFSAAIRRYRVFHVVNHERMEVQILAFGIKDRNRLFVGGEEIKL